MTQSFTHAKAGVERRLAAHVVTQGSKSAISTDEQRGRARQSHEAGCSRMNDNVWLEIGVFAQAERRFGGQINVVRRELIPATLQRHPDDFVPDTFRRHRNQFPPDELDALVLLHHAGSDHRLHLRDGKASTRQSLGGRGHSDGGRFHEFARPLSRRADVRLSSSRRSAKVCGAERGTIRSVAAKSRVSL